MQISGYYLRIYVAINNTQSKECEKHSHLYKGADGDAQPLLNRTNVTHQVFPRQCGVEGHQHHHCAAQQAGDT